MKKHVLYCKSENGKFIFEKPFDIKNLPGKMEKCGRIKVTWEKYQPKKSLKQLGYMHGGIFPFLEKETFPDFGLTAEEWYQFFKGKFGLRKHDTTGSIEIIRSISTYTEKELADLITKILDWLYHELHITVPPANKIEEYV